MVLRRFGVLSHRKYFSLLLIERPGTRFYTHRSIHHVRSTRQSVRVVYLNWKTSNPDKIGVASSSYEGCVTEKC